MTTVGHLSASWGKRVLEKSDFLPHSNREIGMSSGSHNCLSNEDFELEGLVNDISRSDSSGSLSAV